MSHMAVSQYRQHFVKLAKKEQYFCKLCETVFTAKGDHPREWDHHYKRVCRPFMKKKAAEQKAAAQNERKKSVEVTPTPEQGMKLRSKKIVGGTPIPEQGVQRHSVDAAMAWCEGAQSIELQAELGNQMTGIETAPVLQEKCKPYKKKEGKFPAEPRGGATARSAPQKAAEQHGSTEDGNPTLKQKVQSETKSVSSGTPILKKTVQCKTKNVSSGIPTLKETVQCKTKHVSGGVTSLKKVGERRSIEIIEVTPTLQQVEKPPSVKGTLVDADCCEGAQSLQLRKESEKKVPQIEVTPAMQPNPPSSPRSPPVTNNLSPNHFWTPPAPSHHPQVYHSSGGPSLTAPAIHSPFSFSHPSPAYSYPSSTYSQPPNFHPPPYPHPQTPLYYPYQQYDTHPQQSQHPQPQHPHANWGQLPEQPNRQHEKSPVVYQFQKVEGATFIVSNNQTSPNVSPGAKQLEQPKTMAQPLRQTEQRAGQAKQIVVLETNKGMNDSTLYGLRSHIINMMNYIPGCKEISCDLADLHVLGHLDSIKFYVEVKNFRGANKVLQLNGSDIFGVTLRAYLTDKVDEEAVSVVPLP